MILFHYIPGNSFFHKTNPGVKLIIILVYSILIFLLRFPLLFIILFVEILLLIASKIRIKQVLKEFKHFFLFLLIIFAVRAYSVKELTIVLKVLPVPSIPGLVEGGYIILRLCLVILLGLLLTLTTTIYQLQNVLYSFLYRIPLIPAGRIATLMSLTIGSLPLLFDKINEVDEAQQARCIQSNRNPCYKIISFALPLFVHILKKADDIACSMEARCYTEDTEPLPEAFHNRDRITLIVSTMAGIIALVLHCLFPVIF